MRVIENLLGQLVDRLRPPLGPVGIDKTADRSNPISVNLFGFDKSTRFMIRFLESRNISVSTIYTNNPLFSDHEALGVPIRSREQMRDQTLPIVVGIFCPPEDAAKLMAAEYAGTVLRADVPGVTWRSPPRVDFRALLAATFRRWRGGGPVR